MKKTIVAFMYDFDKTLSPKDMQEYSFIPSIGLKAEEFWAKCQRMTEATGMDSVLCYMYEMVKQAKKNNVSITRESFEALGKDVQLYNGVKTWFKRINEYAASLGIQLEHYIISSGLAEIIRGTSIADEFKQIYACEFLYSRETGEAIWPRQAINYTTKTQFLFRISKGVFKTQEDFKLNAKITDEERYLPYRNMIYFGDGLTDVPCMKIIKENGGYSIAIYNEDSFKNAKKLKKEGRVQFFCKADYSENTELDVTVKAILREMQSKNEIEGMIYEQEQSIKD